MLLKVKYKWSITEVKRAIAYHTNDLERCTQSNGHERTSLHDIKKAIFMKSSSLQTESSLITIQVPRNGRTGQ